MSLVNLPVSASSGSTERRSPATSSSTPGGGGSSRPAEYSKLVRGQDVWLSGGGERTRRSILRCIQCGESFRSLPELTVHMVHTRHYTNIVGATPTSTTSGHVALELPVVGSTHARKQQQQQMERSESSGYVKTRKSPVISRESVRSIGNPTGNLMTSDSSDASRHTVTAEYSEHYVTPHRSTNHSPASLPEPETGRHSAGIEIESISL